MVKEHIDTNHGFMRTSQLFCLILQLLILMTEVVDNRYTIEWHGIFRIIFIICLLFMAGETVYRIT